MNVVKGDLIELALKGEFDVIAHGLNCFCVQRAGLAKQMSEFFDTHLFRMENRFFKKNIGDVNKLGQIESHKCDVHKLYGSNVAVMDGLPYQLYRSEDCHAENQVCSFDVVNCYIQYNYGRGKAYLHYEALTVCMMKLNIQFKGKHIGLPKIGCGLAGGDWSRVRSIIERNLKDCKVTIVEYN